MMPLTVQILINHFRLFSRHLVCFGMLFFCAASAQADVLLLVHGYLGNAYSWQAPNILPALQKQGYQHVGILGYSPTGMLVQTLDEASGNSVYSANLPSQAPVSIQADWLNTYLSYIAEQHPKQAVIVIAHSAGGVVARMTLVRHQPAQVKWLITIASPHQGTSRAYQALAATDNRGWFGGVKSWLVRREIGNSLYHTLRQSRGVLLDLAPPRPGNLLFWLNQQPHPAIRYTSIIRLGTQQTPGDPIVPAFSQDLCLIPQIARHAERYLSQQGHLLTPGDGKLLLGLLRDSAQPKALTRACVIAH